MSFNQTRDVLDHAREFHRRMIQFYDTLLGRTDDAETYGLIQKLIEREQRVDKGLGEYEEEVSGNTLDTYFKYVVDCFEAQIKNYPIPDRVDTKYVIDSSRYLDTCLEKYYGEMAKKAVSMQVRDVLESLRKMEQREQVTLSRIMLDLKMPEGV